MTMNRRARVLKPLIVLLLLVVNQHRFRTPPEVFADLGCDHFDGWNHCSLSQHEHGIRAQYRQLGTVLHLPDGA